MTIAVLDDEVFEAHGRPGHPERPQRLTAARSGIEDAARALGDRWRRLVVPPRTATADELAAVHSPRYVEDTLEQIAHGTGHLDADTYYGPGTGLAALSAAGGLVDTALRVFRGEAARGVALVRPPGHHAEREHAMGFCLFNNIAVATAQLLAAGARRLLVLDWDAHHGNGTQHAFERDPRVLFVSLHQHPFYPGTGHEEEIGTGEGTGSVVNLPMPAGSGPADYAAAFERIVLGVASDFAPEMVLVSAGFDAHARDPLTDLRLDAESYAAMARAVRGVTATGKTVLALEGGYDLEAIRASMAASVVGLAESRGPDWRSGDASPAVDEMLRRQVVRLGELWAALRD